ncbi:MAG: hypothetical protein A3C93_03825 [Candidatus Lloydbacteria bacterium RIFCSPHIGHO2_02_FULL_54_17]|uniref:DUF5673 domain-containing protein n=1 Tax=Candidatus Lloydbacteria bacterium RIFCSPHIGHO2_02_FULL_54_17 TaxID=1798664 RepID=A0A1G2DHL2_9BACT|nr:MAG: hypothetical protein A2762_00235 [Candidatus Lloydbacteria bacterium RIFCSPHIGHO2_01_FULL_54_11]OGZ13003.1 MAG: hypothetical protein A3C93_03825 [Candidatus Lloydbacteria bacterium RIFCSPHIGHO2_02_FULL_54_17]OGZ15114.1 MAG: hypothetical protein A3H76_00440 [Candidatus Lloydbacteria bacterium RIFCSPLOWO2_02_FULL_54_12]OGZ15238.1 MAG: hypothetical protein A2948_05505 [Candidatus Lloydbacteria bacterium RIFCSPLOWO2_01_FULL_54_18]
MQWETPEHQYKEKTNDWYASVILIAGALIAVEFLLNNFLLITLTVIGTIAFLLLAARRPELMHVEIGSSGVRTGNLLHPYTSLDGFTIAEYAHEHRLLLESNRHFLPLIVIPIPDTVNSDDVRNDIAEYLPEKELHESLPHLLFERLGF